MRRVSAGGRSASPPARSSSVRSTRTRPSSTSSRPVPRRSRRRFRAQRARRRNRRPRRRSYRVPPPSPGRRGAPERPRRPVGDLGPQAPGRGVARGHRRRGDEEGEHEDAGDPRGAHGISFPQAPIECQREKSLAAALRARRASTTMRGPDARPARPTRPRAPRPRLRLAGGDRSARHAPARPRQGRLRVGRAGPQVPRRAGVAVERRRRPRPRRRSPAPSPTQMRQLEYAPTLLGLLVRAGGASSRRASRSMAPKGLTRVVFTSGGSEANETVIRLVRLYWRLRGNVPTRSRSSRSTAPTTARRPAPRASPGLPYFHKYYEPLLPGVRAHAAAVLLPLRARPDVSAVRPRLRRRARAHHRARGRRHHRRVHRRAGAGRRRRGRAAARLLRAHPRHLRQARRAAGRRRGDHRLRPPRARASASSAGRSCPT